MNRPFTTLFMLMSLDGKISTGVGDERDFDKDLPNISDLSKGVEQYYHLEQETDLFSLNTGKVMAKVGWNDKKPNIEQIPVTFIIIDSKPHLTILGVENLLKRTEKLYIVTTNKDHPANTLNDEGLEVMTYEGQIDFVNLFTALASKDIRRVTIQSGGELNAVLVRAGLIDELSVVVAPVLVGGKDTPTLIDGDSISSIEDLKLLRPLELIEAKPLNNSFVHMKYRVKD